MEAVVVVVALAVGGLLVVKSLNREDLPPPKQEIALARRDDGSWEPRRALHDDSTLTVTLVVPWDEVGERYSSLNVVVR